MDTWLWLMVIASGIAMGAAQEGVGADLGPFAGLKAFVAQPENSWTWDSAVYGALDERGVEVTFGLLPEDAAALGQYDLVALSIKRDLTPRQSAALEAYVADGGAVYGSWGGPMGASGFLQTVCKVGLTRSVRLRQLTLLDGPIAQGIPDRTIALRERVGHMAGGPQGWEIVAVEPLGDGLPVARDAAGSNLGVLARFGKGRTAVLGFGPEQDEYLASAELAPRMMDNLLLWLVEGRLGEAQRRWSNRVTVAVPARAQVLGVTLDGKAVPVLSARRIGSLRKLELDVEAVGPGQEAVLRVAYKPLESARNVETVVHLPWNTLRAAAHSPAELAEYLGSLGATTVQPLLRGSFGEAWYKGMPEDQPDDVLVRDYQGNFLRDLISECHKRGIKVIGGVYLDNAEPVRRHPEVQRLDRQGNVVKDQYGRPLACFHNPLGLAHSLATIGQLLDDYELDGVILDDNFELDKEDCYCAYCRDAFRRYCESRGLAFQDSPAAWGEALAEPWREHRREAARALAAQVRDIARAHGVRAGGWVGSGMDATHLRASFDFLGGMVYTEPPRSVRAPLSVLGDCGFIGLLWAPGSDPQAMERQVRQAVRSGCAAVGFWVRGEDGGYRLDAERSEAIRRAFGAVEREWLGFYGDSLLSGDVRFAVLHAAAGRQELMLTLRNAGERVSRRIQGPVDLSALSADRP